MITPAQHKRLVKEYQNNGGVVSHAALKANMHPEPAARYLQANVGPEERKQERDSLIRFVPERSDLVIQLRGIRDLVDGSDRDGRRIKIYV